MEARRFSRRLVLCTRKQKSWPTRAVDAEGKQHPGSPAKTIYKIHMVAEGFKGRPK